MIYPNSTLASLAQQYGQVPALRNHANGGAVLAQSAAILKFVGKQCGLYPRDDEWLAVSTTEKRCINLTTCIHSLTHSLTVRTLLSTKQKAKIDALMDEENDLFCGLTVSRYPWRFGFDAVGMQGVRDRDCPETAKVRAQLANDTLPRHLAHLEKILADGGTGWLAGTAAPTVADFQMVPRLQWLVTSNDGIPAELLKGYPKLQALVDNTMALPAVVEYYAARGEVYDPPTYSFKKSA